MLASILIIYYIVVMSNYIVICPINIPINILLHDYWLKNIFECIYTFYVCIINVFISKI